MKRPFEIKKRELKPLKSNPTSLDLIQYINAVMGMSGLEEDAMAKSAPALEKLANKYGISQDAALILAAIVETSANRSAFEVDLARFFDCSNVQIFIYKPVIESLMERGFIRAYERNFDGMSYNPSKELMTSLLSNGSFTKPSLTDLDLRTFLIEMSKLEDERHDDHLDYDIFISETKRLIQNNSHLSLSKFLVTEIGFEKENEPILIFLLRACILAKLYNQCSISKNECNKVFYDEIDVSNLSLLLDKYSGKESPVQVFEPAIPTFDSLADFNRVSLTQKFCKRYLDGLNLERKKLESEVGGGIIYPDKIAKKKLFYNPEEETRITELSKLLKPRNLNRIQKRLNEYGYRSGFACLFYGAPGTGKTETAMQLALATGRNVIPVDLSQVRDKYVGESEKRTKAIFDDYRDAMKKSKLAPILLLNEADGLLAKRFTTVDHNAEQMENTMQNILLQEMETFEGILIATTNLTCNLDSAFERRFLYKIEFRKPSVEARQSIWQTMIHDLKPADAKILAEDFDFTGGEIENIARKYVIDTILHNANTEIEALRQMCRDERLNKTDDRKRITLL